jgi:hypothetical protein
MEQVLPHESLHKVHVFAHKLHRFICANAGIFISHLSNFLSNFPL